MKPVGLLLCAVVIAIALPGTPAISQGAPPAAIAFTQAQQLARTVLPDGEILGIRLLRFSKAYATELKTGPRFVALEKQYPGISDVFAVVARDEALQAYRRAIALLQEDAAKIYAANFTDVELAKLISFFRTPTGAAMITMSAASGGDSASDFEADRRAKAIAFLQKGDAQMKRDLTPFIQSGLQPKARAIAPQISALSARRFDDVSIFLEAALPARIDAVIARAKKAPKP
jgi:Uncharacterized protein conserved in bacteria (DUF2059)